MPSAPVQAVLDKLHRVKAAGSGKWQALCPVHEADGNGHKASLSIAQGDDGRALLNCQAGCPTSAVAFGRRKLWRVEELTAWVAHGCPPRSEWTKEGYRP